MNRKLRRAEKKQSRPVVMRQTSPCAQESFAEAVRNHQAGRLDEAVAGYRRTLALRPDDPETHNNLGVALRGQGRLGEAVASYSRALALRPDYRDAHSNLGIALAQQGRLDEAVASYGRALVLRPDYPEAHNNLGSALAQQGRLDEAAAHFGRALALRPDYPEAHNNLGGALAQQGRMDEAVVHFRCALALRPDYPEAHNDLGSALAQQGRLDEAVASYGRALALRPDYPEAHSNLGSALADQGRSGEAVAHFRRALALRPDYPEAHSNLAIVLLARGDMAAGWEEYEWRWKVPHMIKATRNFAQPRWRGEAAEGRTLLIHAEQGFGDTVQFCRYAPLAANRGLRVILEVQEPLLRLLRCLPGVDLVAGPGEDLPSFDLHCPMLSLPLALATATASIPSAASYLHSDQAQVAAWRTRLGAMEGERLRIGLAWAGNPDLPSDRRRSLTPDRLAPLFDVSGLHFFSLQKGGPTAPEAFPLTDLMDELGDFADTAALVANLDLVISVDTAVAHLAAAIGKPVWLLNRFDSCWRWQAGRRDSPWYPTLRLYRQPRPGDWATVLAEVARDLRALRA
jgi:Flp pilus assembly protein TadD